jgi:hypothetical protein
MRHLNTIITLIFILISSLSFGQDFIKKHKTDKITLTEIKDSIKIGFETDSAIIYFGVNDMTKTIEDILSSGKLQPRWDYRTIDDLKGNLKFLQSIKSDLIVKDWQSQRDSVNIDLYNISGFIDQWIFKDYLFDKKAEVWNKAQNRYEKIIYYNFIEDRLGGEQCYYTFEDKTVFHRQIIALGE